MSKNEKLNDQDRWLAAEYALGVLTRSQMNRAAKRVESDQAFRGDVESWQAQLSPILEDVEEIKPPAAVWQSIDNRLFEPVSVTSPSTGAQTGSGFWKLMTALTSTVAVACFAVLMFATGGDITGRGLEQAQQEIAVRRTKSTQSESELVQAREELNTAALRLADLERQNETSGEALDGLQRELSETRDALEAANQEVASVRQQVLASKPLVASLTQSGDAPAFVAQYDPLKKALLIRTAVEDTDEKVPEVWLIPAQGDRKGEVLSLGVMDEAAPDTLPISDDFVSLIGEGGTLAITMEPVGGAPNGVATGPVIALGQLQAF